MKTIVICVTALVLMLELTATVSTAGKGIMLMNRIGPSSADLFIANGDGACRSIHQSIKAGNNH